jgi:DNA-binding transcriptional ArsR family regulator
MGSPDKDTISALRSVAHPVRLRILSLLTAQAMSAAEVARELDLTHANASYHLRVLHDAGELVVESEEKIRGGTAKRYRYVVGADRGRPSGPPRVDDEIAWQQATHSEVVRRLTHRERGPGSSADIETWVTPETWREAVDLIARATVLLHEQAMPPRSEGTIHVSASTQAFMMDDAS